MKESFESPSKNVDFLSEKVNFKMQIGKEVAEHMPHISDEDMKTHIEKYSNIIGIWEVEVIVGWISIRPYIRN